MAVAEDTDERLDYESFLGFLNISVPVVYSV